VTRPSIVAPWLATIGLFIALVATAAVAGQYPGIGGGGTVQLVTFFGLIGIWGVANATVGALIASRRPDNRVGRILQAGGLLVIGVFLGFLVSAVRAVTAEPGDLLGAVAGWWAAVTIFPAILVAWPLMAILFPDGRLPGPRWRGPVAFVTIGEVAISIVAALTVGPVAPGLPDNPFGVLAVAPGVVALLGLAGAALIVVSLGLAFTAIGIRWHRGDRLLRAQLKWLVGALGVGAILFPLGFGGDVVNPLDYLGVGSATLVPIAIGIAILRYRLYDIDRIISRTLTYGVLTLVLVGVYTAGFALLQTVISPFTSGGGPFAVAASTLAAFALFQPLRRRIHAAMDRRFNRSRYDAQQTVAGFAARLRDEVDIATVATDLHATVLRAVNPSSLSLWIREARP
jgi:hypothetical protein